MLNLVFKDFIIQKKSVLFALLYIVFFMFAFQSIGQAMYPASVTAFSYILGMGAFALDDKNKTDVMFNCLPVKRSLLVTSKYVSVILSLQLRFNRRSSGHQFVRLGGCRQKRRNVSGDNAFF
jgi:ABC-2 type transport system permease protein